jgi:hypothetical protein
MKRYGEMTPEEREAAWGALPEDDPFAAPHGYTAWAEANLPATPYRAKRREQWWGTTRHGYQRRPR